MKTIQELIDMQTQKNNLYDEIKASDEENELLKKEKCIIAGHWVDYIDELLYYNFMKFMEEHGYDEKRIRSKKWSAQPSGKRSKN